MKNALFSIIFVALFLSSCSDDKEKLENSFSDADLDEIIATDMDVEDLADEDDMVSDEDTADEDFVDEDMVDELVDELVDEEPLDEDLIDEDLIDEDVDDDDVIVPENVICVKYDASGLNDGTSWEDALTDLSVAIDLATDGKDIWVAAGTYHPTDCPNMYEECTVTTPQRMYHFSLMNGVGIYGGFVGTEGDVSERDWENNETILSGDFNGDDDTLGNSENAYHVFYHDGWERKDSSAILDGFTISGGNADGDEWPYQEGGGIRTNKRSGFEADHITPIIRNCIFKNNSALLVGGAMYNHEGASPTIENCTFIDNTAEKGGAIYNYQGSPLIKDSTFSGNTAIVGGAMGVGGAVGVEDSDTTIEDSVFTGNSADSGGGAVYLNGTVTSVIRSSLFNGNTSVNAGAIISYEVDSLTIESCYFHNNAATGASLPNGMGGAIQNQLSDTVIVNSVFEGNSAIFGTIANIYSNSSIINCSISGNTAGSGITNGQSNPEISNTIIYGNLDNDLYNIPEGPPFNLEKSIPEIDHSDIGGCGGSGNDCGAGSDPCWVADCGNDNGGNIDDDPLFFNSGDDPFSLTELSPCIDTGDNAKVPVMVTKDVKGDDRIQGLAVDMGAYENK